MKVAYFILNRFDNDSRARLEVETIMGMGHEVEIIATVGGSSSEFMGCPIHRISQHTWPSRKIRFIEYNLQAASIVMKLKPDVCHAVDADTLYAAYRASKSGGKLVYEARELYTELEPLSGRTAVKKFWRIVESRLIAKADSVVTINESLADELVRRYGIERPAVIRNVAPIARNLKPVDLRKRYGISPDFRILIYQGVLRKGQGLIYLLEILSRLQRVFTICIGYGPMEGLLRRRATELGVGDRVVFAGFIEPDDLAAWTASGDAGVLLMEDACLNNRLALPQKLFQYLAVGLPQIVTPMPEIAGFVESEKTGIVVPSGDSSQAASMIAGFLDDEASLKRIRENCRISAMRNNWQNESQKWIAIYEALEKRR